MSEVKKRMNELETLRKYHNLGSKYKRVENAIFLANGSIKHELAKCVGAIMLNRWGSIVFDYALKKHIEELALDIETVMRDFVKDKHSFISEAVPNDNPKRKIDLVDNTVEVRYEFETNQKIKKEGAHTIYI